jgi:hypothetical protein
MKGITKSGLVWVILVLLSGWPTVFMAPAKAQSWPDGKAPYDTGREYQLWPDDILDHMNTTGEEKTASLVAAVELANGNSVEFYKGVLGEIVVVEKGPMGNGSLAPALRGMNAAETWKALVPDAAVPTPLVEKPGALANDLFTPGEDKPVDTVPRLSSSLSVAATTESLCGCYAVIPPAAALKPWKQCYLGATTNTSFNKDEVVSAETGVCNHSRLGPVHLKVQYRTWWWWNTVTEQDLPSGWWWRGWKTGDLGGLFDFDWSSAVTRRVWRTGTAPPAPDDFLYDHIIRGLVYEFGWCGTC